MKRLREWYWKRRQHRMCEEMRYTLAVFGYDITGMSDEEIVQRVQEFNQRCIENWRRLSLSASECAEGFKRLAVAFTVPDDPSTT